MPPSISILFVSIVLWTPNAVAWARDGRLGARARRGQLSKWVRNADAHIDHGGGAARGSGEKDPKELAKELVALREKWKVGNVLKGVGQGKLNDWLKSGQIQVPGDDGDRSLSAYVKDLRRAEELVKDRGLFEFAKDRLRGLELKEKYKQWKAKGKDADPRELPVDVHTAPKVDNHNHHSAAMTQQHLLDFISSVLKQEHHMKAIEAYLKGQQRTTQTALDEFNKIAARAKSGTLTLSYMDVFAGDHTYDRFDVFNGKYSPFGVDALRSVFLKPTVEVNVTFPGDKQPTPVRYVADLTHDICHSLPSDYFPEWRLSVYGFSQSEYKNLLGFFDYKDIRGTKTWYGIGQGPLPAKEGERGGYYTVAERCEEQVKWMLQVPRIYHVSKPGTSFSTYITNLWKPLLEKQNETMKLMKYVSGFDSVDDETQDAGDIWETGPADVVAAKGMEPPPFSYYMYFMALGVAAVSEAAMTGGTQLTFRPHCGEGGSVKHLIVCAMLADGISHGTQLRNSPVAQYMYFVTQIPISMSISSNHYLVLKSRESPFGMLFFRGLFITLSTDDPLIFFDIADERACLMHDYGLAEKLFDEIGWPDLAEVARNSLLMSGLDAARVAKLRWADPAAQGSAKAFDRWQDDSQRTGVPQARVRARKEAWCFEIRALGLDYEECKDVRSDCPDAGSAALQLADAEPHQHPASPS